MGGKGVDSMFIHPFAAGVLATILIELLAAAALIGAAAYRWGKKK